MRAIRFFILTLVPGHLLLAAEAGGSAAAEIMARVAADQDHAQQVRAEYVYQQHVRVATLRTRGKLAREEIADYVVMPTPEGTKKSLLRNDGRYWHRGSIWNSTANRCPNRIACMETWLRVFGRRRSTTTQGTAERATSFR